MRGSVTKLEHEHEYEIWVSCTRFGKKLTPFRWGGRPLTLDECMRELELIWSQYIGYNFDPYCHGQPLDPDKECLSAKCAPIEYYSYSADYCPSFGFIHQDDDDDEDYNSIWNMCQRLPNAVVKPFYFRCLKGKYPPSKETLKIKTWLEDFSNACYWKRIDGGVNRKNHDVGS